MTMDYYNNAIVGYVFQPSVEEIMTVFLPKRVADEPIGSPPHLYENLVRELDLYEANMEPCEIFDEKDGQDDSEGIKCFYFFTRVKKLSAKAGSKRSRRTAGKGTWRGEGPEEIRAMIMDSSGNVVDKIIGTKRLFKYTLANKEYDQDINNNNNNDSDGVVVSWTMHEYQLNFECDNPLLANAKPHNHDIVFCRVKKNVKINKNNKRAISLVSDNNDDPDINVPNKRLNSSDYYGGYHQDIDQVVVSERVNSSDYYGGYGQDNNAIGGNYLCRSEACEEQEDVSNQQASNNNASVSWSNGLDQGYVIDPQSSNNNASVSSSYGLDQGGVSNQQASNNNNIISNEDMGVEDGVEMDVSQFLNNQQVEDEANITTNTCLVEQQDCSSSDQAQLMLDNYEYDTSWLDNFLNDEANKQELSHCFNLIDADKSLIDHPCSTTSFDVNSYLGCSL